jgi:dienelactone hydrolase
MDGERQREEPGALVEIPTERVWLGANLVIPQGAEGIVVFAHGSGSSRFSPRNRFVARALRAGGLGTLLVDLLTVDEERVDAVTGARRFDVDRLAQRIISVADWVATRPETRALRVGLFGARAGAAAALVAAAERPDTFGAIVSRGGRPELAGAAVRRVSAPTLLIVGQHDEDALATNEDAYTALPAIKELAVVPRATHLFAEPGALDIVAELARRWFERFLAPGRHEVRTPSAP